MANTLERVNADPVANEYDSVTPVAPPIEAAPRLSDVLRGGLATGITASLVCWLLFGIGTLFGTEFDIRYRPGGGLTHVPWWEVLLVPAVVTILFAAGTAALRERRRCRVTALILGYCLGTLSILLVLLQQSDVTWPTKVWLTLMNLVTITLAVPQVARIVGDSDPFVTAGHRRSGLDAA